MSKKEVMENIALTVILLGGMYLVCLAGYLFN